MVIFNFLLQNMVFESQLALRRVYRVQGFENISIITYKQTIFKSTYQSVLKICHIRLFFVFCSSLTDVMIDFSDQLHDIFPKFRIKARFFQHFCGSSSSINDFLVYSTSLTPTSSSSELTQQNFR